MKAEGQGESVTSYCAGKFKVARRCRTAFLCGVNVYFQWRSESVNEHRPDIELQAILLSNPMIVTKKNPVVESSCLQNSHTVKTKEAQNL